MPEGEIKIRPEIEALSAKLEDDPKSLVFAPLADAYRKSNMIDEAIEICQRGLQIHPDYAVAHLVLGRCYIEKRILSLAGEEFEKVIQLDHNNIVALKLLGDVFASQGLIEKAVEKYKRVLELDPLNLEIQEKLTSLTSKAIVSEEFSSDTKESQLPSLEEVVKPEAQAVSSPPEVPPLEPEVVGVSSISVEEEKIVEKKEEMNLEKEKEEEKAILLSEEDLFGESVYLEAKEEKPELPVFEEKQEKESTIELESSIQGPPMRLDEEILQSPIAEKPILTGTLAEIYAHQGFVEKALEIYKEILAREPEDKEVQAKIMELEAKLATSKEKDSFGFEEIKPLAVKEEKPEKLSVEEERIPAIEMEKEIVQFTNEVIAVSQPEAHVPETTELSIHEEKKEIEEVDFGSLFTENEKKELGFIPPSKPKYVPPFTQDKEEEKTSDEKPSAEGKEAKSFQEWLASLKKLQ